MNDNTKRTESSKKEQQSNQLRNAVSPYLRAHAYDPVHWYEWDADTFTKAAREDRPVFLSVGYSSCHWCHVMANESFRDNEIASLINEHFVPIKVDREDRPDIDAVYMGLCHFMSGRGGWPLTIIMTPDKKPFFAGTYLPKRSRYGMAGLFEILTEARRLWAEERDHVNTTTTQIITAFSHNYQPAATQGIPLTEAVFHTAFKTLSAAFDKDYGGFGIAPKFPMGPTLLFLLHYGTRFTQPKAHAIVLQTLDAMRQGGIYDHLGYGFHRYATDQKWHVPHFEKMLNDQAMMALVYLEAFQRTGEPRFRQIVDEVFTYVLRDMMSNEGGFFTAEDADSEGHEGSFYLWSHDELTSILPPDDFTIAETYFSISKQGNFIDSTSGQPSGTNILYTEHSLEHIAHALGLPQQRLEHSLTRILSTLKRVRNQRPRPTRDDKILTDNNALMIVALARAARLLGAPSYCAIAEKTLTLLLSQVVQHDQVFHRVRNGHVSTKGFLNDYAYLIWALIELYQTTFNTTYLADAQRLCDAMITRFYDTAHEGFTIMDDTTDLPVTYRDVYGTVTLSGNAVAALDLLLLGKLTGRTDYLDVSDRVITALSPTMHKTPHAFVDMLIVLDIARQGTEVVVVGDLQASDTRMMIEALHNASNTSLLIVHRPPDETSVSNGFNPAIQRMLQREGKATAYVCHGTVCLPPTTDIKSMMSLMHEKPTKR